MIRTYPCRDSAHRDDGLQRRVVALTSAVRAAAFATRYQSEHARLLSRLHLARAALLTRCLYLRPCKVACAAEFLELSKARQALREHYAGMRRAA